MKQMRLRKSYLWTLIRHREWNGVVDSLAHRLHFPKPIQHRLCDRWDKYLMGDDDDESSSC